ncbi:hypothetical protein WICPIJ_005390, partial [Wickerhamomyces pijperi]
ALTGVKAELISRLEEDDASKASASVSDPVAAPVPVAALVEETKPQEELIVEEEITQPATTEQQQDQIDQNTTELVTAAPVEPTEEEKTKIASLITRWETANKDFQTQINRLEKFGGDEAKLEKLKSNIAANEAKIADIKINGLKKKSKPTKAQAKAETEAVAEAAPKLSAEELKILVVENLTKKLERATKFGSEEEKESITKELKRVEKFGVEADSQLARELGLLNDKELNKNKFRVSKRRGYRSRR